MSEVRTLLSLLVLLPLAAQAQGIQLDRYEPTAAGEGFAAVQAPWYRGERLYAVGLGLDYGRDVVTGGTWDADGRFTPTVGVISAQLAAHLDVAVSPFDRWLFSASLPLNVLEQGTAAFGVTPIASPALGDPRLGADYRVFGELTKDALSLHLGARLWVPIGASASHAGDESLRGQLHAVIGGRALPWLEWAANGAVYLRQEASLNGFADGVGAVGSELRLAGGAAYVDPAGHFRAGAELLFGTALPGTSRFGAGSSHHLEMLLSGSYRFANAFQIGPAVGFSPLRTDGTPAMRAIVRFAYAPGSEGRQKVTPRVVEAAPVEERTEVAQAEDPAVAGEPDSAVAAEPEPAVIAEPEPAVVAESEPAVVAEAKPAVVAEPEPARVAEPEPAVVAEPEPEPARVAQREEPEPVTVAEASPAESDEEADPDPTPVAEPEPSRFAFVPALRELPAGCRASEPYPSGAQLVIETFALNESRLSAAGRAEVARLAKALRRAPGVRVTVTGHTDDLGSDALNAALSQRRAEVVKQALVRAGVAADRIDAEGRAAEVRSCPDPTPEHRAASRRAEIDLVQPR